MKPAATHRNGASAATGKPQRYLRRANQHGNDQRGNCCQARAVPDPPKHTTEPEEPGRKAAARERCRALRPPVSEDSANGRGRSGPELPNSGDSAAGGKAASRDARGVGPGRAEPWWGTSARLLSWSSRTGHAAPTVSLCRFISSRQVKPQPEPLVSMLLTGGNASTFITVQKKLHVIR